MGCETSSLLNVQFTKSAFCMNTDTGSYTQSCNIGDSFYTYMSYSKADCKGKAVYNYKPALKTCISSSSNTSLYFTCASTTDMKKSIMGSNGVKLG